MAKTGVGTFSKELHFFDRQISSKDLDWYERQFDPEEGHEPRSVRGEITPSYSTLHASVVNEIARYAPELKLILILRHPVDRIWSHMRMRTAAWSADGKIDEAGLSVRRLIRDAETYETILRTDYGRMIDNWTAAFGDEALHIVLFDEQFAEPAGTLERILRHIDADPSWSPGEDRMKARVWPGPSAEIPEMFAYHLASRWLEPTEALNRRLDGRLDHWVSDIRRTCDRGASRFGTAAALYRTLSLPRKARSLVRQVAKTRRLRRRLRHLLDAREGRSS